MNARNGGSGVADRPVQSRARLQDQPVVAGALEVDHVLLDRRVLPIREGVVDRRGHAGAASAGGERVERRDLGSLPRGTPTASPVADGSVERCGAPAAADGQLRGREAAGRKRGAGPGAVARVEGIDVGADGSSTSLRPRPPALRPPRRRRLAPPGSPRRRPRPSGVLAAAQAEPRASWQALGLDGGLRRGRDSSASSDPPQPATASAASTASVPAVLVIRPPSQDCGFLLMRTHSSLERGSGRRETRDEGDHPCLEVQCGRPWCSHWALAHCRRRCLDGLRGAADQRPFANRTTIGPALPINNVWGTTVDATAEANEPGHPATAARSNSIWYQWQAPALSWSGWTRAPPIVRSWRSASTPATRWPTSRTRQRTTANARTP